MTEPTAPERTDRHSRAAFQFGIQDVLGMFVLVSVLLSYLRPFGVPVILKLTCLVGLALLCGGAIGLVARRFSEAVFWSAIGSILGYLTIVNAPLSHWTGEYVWPMLGGIVGAVAAAVSGKKARYRVAYCSLLGLGLVSLYELALLRFTRDSADELVCATAGSALLAVVVELAGRFERWTSVPRHLIAIGFVVAGIAVHWVALRLAPGL
jgi:hypothetical protein